MVDRAIMIDVRDVGEYGWFMMTDEIQIDVCGEI